jgi:8-oxo-dGTP pyrophosphatase MutT (NUDIX family)
MPNNFNEMRKHAANILSALELTVSSYLPNEALGVLGRSLPWVAEEGGERESVAERVLVDLVSSAAGSRAAAQVIVAVARQQLLALSLLDREAISRGEWRLVSFPARLCARSLLMGLATDGYQAIEPGFWELSEYLIDRQRGFLRQLELRRMAASAAAEPIRRVCVSWATLAFDGNFLLVRREDSRERREGSRGAFVLPGGKLSSADLHDLPVPMQRKYFDPCTHVEELGDLAQALSRTLIRELHEEVGVDATAISSLSPSHKLIRHVDLEGAGSNYSLTEFLIQLFHVDFTDTGREQLLRSIAGHPERYSWFTTDELAEGKNSRGETAYVTALRSALNGTLRDPLSNDLSLEASSKGRLIDKPFDIPHNTGEPLLIGATGNERAVQLGLQDSTLTDLAFLAAVRRGDPTRDLAAGVSVAVGPGWLLVDDDMHYRRLVALSTSVNQAVSGTPLIVLQGRAARLNVADPELVCFSPEYFSAEAVDINRGKNYRIRVTRHAIVSPLGVADALVEDTQVSEILGGAIYGLLHGDPSIALENIDSVKRMQRAELATIARAVGARLLVRQVDGVPQLAIAR